jgi:hypothetical protein
MAVTAGGTPYVESSDLVANYPALSLALAEHIDDLPQTVLQVVRATDVTRRSTTSTSFVDVAGMSVTITPQKSDSAILILGLVRGLGPSNQYFQIRLTDSSNSALSGAEEMSQGDTSSGNMQTAITIIGYNTPATTSAVTYKMRFKTNSGTAQIMNDSNTGQLYALEIGA